MNRYIFTALFIIVAACDLIVDVDIPFERKLVVNCIIHPDSVWYAHISNNKHILDSLGHPRVNNAIAVIYENDSPIDTLQPGSDGAYRSDHGKPIAGKSYEIRIQAGAYDQISAKTTLPEPAPIKGLEVTETRNDLWSSGTAFKIKFLDNEQEKNFYQFAIYSGRDRLTPNFEVVRYYYRTDVWYDDPITTDEEVVFGTEILLKDILFNGKEKEITLQAGYLLPELTVVEVRTLNEDYYNYLATKDVQGTADGDPLAQPINVYSNVQNGFGIFAGYSLSTARNGSDIRPTIKSASTTRAAIGDVITLTVENLNRGNEYHYVNVMFRSRRDMGYVSWPVTITSENTVEVEVPFEAVTGRIAITTRGLIGISDFEIEIVE